VVENTYNKGRKAAIPDLDSNELIKASETAALLSYW